MAVSGWLAGCAFSQTEDGQYCARARGYVSARARRHVLCACRVTLRGHGHTRQSTVETTYRSRLICNFSSWLQTDRNGQTVPYLPSDNWVSYAGLKSESDDTRLFAKRSYFSVLKRNRV